jgi:hypothetical protein
VTSKRQTRIILYSDIYTVFQYWLQAHMTGTLAIERKRGCISDSEWWLKAVELGNRGRKY